MSAAGVWLLEPEVCIQWTGSWEGPGNSNILQEVLTDHWKPTNTNAHNDVDDIPYHSHTTHFLRGWSNPHNQQPFTDCAHLCGLLMEGA